MDAVLSRTSTRRTGRATERLTCICRECGKQMLQTTDMQYALDYRDMHALENLHHTDVWVTVAGRTFRLAGIVDRFGRIFDVE